MGSYKIAVVYGDGIGPEIVASAVGVCAAAASAAGVRIDWVELPGGKAAIDAGGRALPNSTLDRILECDGLILGPVDHLTYPRYADGRRQNPSGELRKRLDLYANIRPARNYPGVRSVAVNTDLVIVRENTEGFYSDRNMVTGTGAFMPTDDVALSVGVFTRRGVGRVTKVAFDLAKRRRQHLTVVHKANVLPDTTGMYIDAAHQLHEEERAVVVDDILVDAMAAALVRRPESFDVIVTENLFGDILSDLTCELVGSLGLAASLNAGDDYAMAQAAHGSAPDIAGRNIANPTSEIVSAAMLLGWIGSRHGDASLSDLDGTIQQAVSRALIEAPTRDVGGVATTRDFTTAVNGAL